MKQFISLTLIVLASTEQDSLKETVNLLQNNCQAEDVEEIIIFLISETCPSAAVAEEIINNNSSSIPIRTCIQQVAGLSSAVFEAAQCVHSSHYIIISADLEMDPFSIPKMVEIGKKHPNAIVCASKFTKGAQRKNYGPIHYVGNRAVNFIIKRILNVKATEITIFFQLYPKSVFDSMKFDNPNTTYYEYIIRPLALDVEYIEIPTNYMRRSEGDSNFNLKKYIHLGVSFIQAALRERKLIKMRLKAKDR